uniref:Uncharacterized protein n=1 Tax=Oryza sativa subsp. japonica TaxID=39947 RepID=Q6YWR3_ORYSJ|nr:hypothetical protein [Oryza sativa Japonica Group]BAD16355.1 hypothetical protein [Oryza sativa Japonica Group]
MWTARLTQTIGRPSSVCRSCLAVYHLHVINVCKIVPATVVGAEPATVVGVEPANIIARSGRGTSAAAGSSRITAYSLLAAIALTPSRRRRRRRGS